MNLHTSKLQEFLDESLKNRQVLQILEAGCGSTSHIHFNNEFFLTGIDISEKQLARNQKLNKKILGDIQTYNFPPKSFDIIVCWYVLEHLIYPLFALTKFSESL